MKASVFIGTSLDGFIARPDGTLDFLDHAGDEPHGYEVFVASVDALVIGRNTYEVVLGFDGWPYGTKPVFVLSSKPLRPAPLGAVIEQMSGEPAAVCASLDARGIKHAYVDGGITIQAFLRARLIQRVVISRTPVIIGTGIPLFGPVGFDIVVLHVATRHFESGLVQSEYEIGASSDAAIA